MRAAVPVNKQAASRWWSEWRGFATLRPAPPRPPSPTRAPQRPLLPALSFFSLFPVPSYCRPNPSAAFSSAVFSRSVSFPLGVRGAGSSSRQRPLPPLPLTAQSSRAAALYERATVQRAWWAAMRSGGGQAAPPPALSPGHGAPRAVLRQHERVEARVRHRQPVAVRHPLHGDPQVAQPSNGRPVGPRHKLQEPLLVPQGQPVHHLRGRGRRRRRRRGREVFRGGGRGVPFCLAAPGARPRHSCAPHPGGSRAPATGSGWSGARRCTPPRTPPPPPAP